MKTIVYCLCGALLATLACNSAGADDVKVNITARVSDVYDPENILGGQVLPGQIFTGYYNYDSSAPPDGSGAPNEGRYQMMGTMASVKLAHGALVFETDVPNVFAELNIVTNEPNDGSDWFNLFYQNNKPLNNGSAVDGVYIRFYDNSGQAPHTTALPTTAPTLQLYSERSVQVWGSLNSDAYQVTLEIESVEFVPPLVIEVSPGASSFLPQQRFDAVLLLPSGSTIASAQATANGSALPLSYPGTCQQAPPNSSGRPAILCPDAHGALATAPATTLVEWSVELSDGTVLTETVEWKLIQ
jgi:hypothetical protein